MSDSHLVVILIGDSNDEASDEHAGQRQHRSAAISRYDIPLRGDLGIYRSARKQGIADEDIEHAVQHALVEGEQDDGVLCLGADRAGNLLKIVSVARADGSEIVIHAMRMRPSYEPFLGGKGEAGD